MSTHYEHNIQDHEDPSAVMTWGIGLIGTILLVVTILGTAALYYNAKAAEVEEMVIQPQREDVRQLRDEQLQILNENPRWVQREDESGEVKKYLAIPIDRAMELVIEQHGIANASATQTNGD